MYVNSKRITKDIQGQRFKCCFNGILLTHRCTHYHQFMPGRRRKIIAIHCPKTFPKIWSKSGMLMILSVPLSLSEIFSGIGVICTILVSRGKARSQDFRCEAPESGGEALFQKILAICHKISFLSKKQKSGYMLLVSTFRANFF